MTNKKGNWLAEQLSGIIIVVIVLALFVGGIYMLYQKITVPNEIETATNMADLIETKINLMEIGDSNNFTFQGSADIESWFIVNWDKSYDPRPEKCFEKPCICISPEPTIESCQTKGIRRTFDVGNVIVEALDIKLEAVYDKDDPLKLSHYEHKLKRLDYIKIPANLFVVEVIKEENAIILTHKTEDYFKHRDKIGSFGGGGKFGGRGAGGTWETDE